MIPNLYFRYLQYKKASIIEPVFHHNAHDLLSLMALKARACFMIEDPEGCAVRHGEDYYGLGRLFEDLGHWDRCISCYEGALEEEIPLHLREEVRRRLSLILKRSGDRARAVQIWQSSVFGNGAEFDFFSCVELAKHKEHQEKDYEGAISIVQQALDRLALLDASSSEMRALGAEFQHRLHRLHCRLRGQRWY
jgi:hypothetical protein